MLKEIRNVKQERGAGRRQWFESDGLDLVVWHDTGGAFTGFQICYDLGRGEHALTWRTNSSFAHSAVDSGDETPFKNETPVLVNDGVVPWAEVTARFDAESASLDPKLRELVLTRLRAHK